MSYRNCQYSSPQVQVNSEWKEAVWNFEMLTVIIKQATNFITTHPVKYLS